MGDPLEHWLKKCPPARDADAAVLIDQIEAVRVLASWPHVRSEWKAPQGSPRAGAIWSWCWRGVSYDLEHLAQLAGISEDRAHMLLHQCADARLAVPDGTISEPAERFLVSRLRARRMRAPKDDKESGE